jgi:hypothetical protein
MSLPRRWSAVILLIAVLVALRPSPAVATGVRPNRPPAHVGVSQEDTSTNAGTLVFIAVVLAIGGGAAALALSARRRRTDDESEPPSSADPT